MRVIAADRQSTNRSCPQLFLRLTIIHLIGQIQVNNVWQGGPTAFRLYPFQQPDAITSNFFLTDRFQFVNNRQLCQTIGSACNFSSRKAFLKQSGCRSLMSGQKNCVISIVILIIMQFYRPPI